MRGAEDSFVEGRSLDNELRMWRCGKIGFEIWDVREAMQDIVLEWWGIVYFSVRDSISRMGVYMGCVCG